MPRNPPSTELRNICQKFTSSPSIYMAGRVKIAPATMTPEQAPMLWIMTFCPRPPFFPRAPVRPTAMMAIGMAASNTWPTLSPRYAAAAENKIVIRSPTVTEYAVTSRGFSFIPRSGL